MWSGEGQRETSSFFFSAYQKWKICSLYGIPILLEAAVSLDIWHHIVGIQYSLLQLFLFYKLSKFSFSG
jgi:hypothetical protein